MAICEAEKTFILHGVEEDFRVDGRKRQDYRPMEVETGIIAHAFGSARLRLANTDALVAIKLEVDTPPLQCPDQGKLEFFVDCSANATPDFEGRGGEDLATEIATCLATAYKSSKSFDLTKLCISKGKRCWKVYVDILLLECGGNLYDAVSLATKAALYDTRIPKVKSVTLDGKNIDLEISENMHECERLDVTNVPVMVTLCKIGDFCVVDPSNHEEQCSSASMLVAVSLNSFSSMTKIGSGSFLPATLLESLEMGLKVGKEVDKALMASLKLEEGLEKGESAGFLL